MSIPSLVSNPGLRQLTVENLRGAVVPFTLPFEKNKKLTIVYGENATGKSTICDAFDFLGKGNVGSLENRGLGRSERYWPSIGKPAGAVSVTLETTDLAKCCAKIGTGGVTVTPPIPRPRVEVLRRKQILKLIEATESERYTEIRRFIDVSAVETSEGTLNQLIKDLNANRNIAAARLTENLDALTNYWNAASQPGSNALTWATTEAKRNQTTLDKEAAALASLQAAYARLTDYPAQLTATTHTQNAAKEADDAAQVAAKQCAQTIAADADEVIGVLQAAQTYLHIHPTPKVCPLCESAEKTAGLNQRISQRLGAFAALQSAQGQVKTTATAVQRAEAQLEVLKADAKRNAETFEKARTDFAWPADIPLPTSPAPTDITALATWLADTGPLPAQWKQAETTRLDKKQFIASLNGALKTYNENVNTQKELDVLLPKLDHALKIVIEERRDFTGKILANIATEVGRMYELVHPGEGLSKISLQLDPKKRASLGIGAPFGTMKETPPQAYFSDSHLDTLGLCIYLALTGRDEPEKIILIIDDVLASVDEPHVQRLIEMLYDETAKFRHCLITTHYRPWKEKFRWGWLKNAQCQFIELKDWTTTEGITHANSVPDIDRLKSLIAEKSPDSQLVCSKAGVMLEAALEFLTLLYQCRVPRKPGDTYTVGDLLPAIDDKLRKSLQVECAVTDKAGTVTYQTKQLGPIFDELDRIFQLRNVFGCHFNEISFTLLNSDALTFGKKVLELIETLADPDAGWPRSDKSGNYWATAKETRRLHPLKKPK